MACVRSVNREAPPEDLNPPSRTAAEASEHSDSGSNPSEHVLLRFEPRLEPPSDAAPRQGAPGPLSGAFYPVQEFSRPWRSHQ